MVVATNPVAQLQDEVKKLCTPVGLQDVGKLEFNWMPCKRGAYLDTVRFFDTNGNLLTLPDDGGELEDGANDIALLAQDLFGVKWPSTVDLVQGTVTSIWQ